MSGFLFFNKICLIGISGTLVFLFQAEIAFEIRLDVWANHSGMFFTNRHRQGHSQLQSTTLSSQGKADFDLCQIPQEKLTLFTSLQFLGNGKERISRAGVE
jgi:hypothetical protein